jgi:hypothetical protein
VNDRLAEVLVALVDDARAFLVDGRPYLNVRQAAVYCGFEPAPGRTAHDKQLRAFTGWAARRGIHPQPGRAVYARADLDNAIQHKPGEPPPTRDLDAMRKLAREDVADRRRRSRLELRRGSKG